MHTSILDPIHAYFIHKMHQIAHICTFMQNFSGFMWDRCPKQALRWQNHRSANILLTWKCEQPVDKFGRPWEEGGCQSPAPSWTCLAWLLCWVPTYTSRSLPGCRLAKSTLVTQRYWFLEFDTISIRYCQNIAISIRYRYFIPYRGRGIEGRLSSTVFAYRYCTINPICRS